jgi:hypothetical protein
MSRALLNVSPLVAACRSLDSVHFRTENGPMDYLTVSSAKPKLGRLMDRVLKNGEPLIIRRGKRFVQISEYLVPEPIPRRPPGYFAIVETPQEYARAKRLAADNPDRPE